MISLVRFPENSHALTLPFPRSRTAIAGSSDVGNRQIAIASALAGSFAHIAGRMIGATLLGVPLGVPPLLGLLYFSLLMFGIGLIVQLVYGGLLYVVLKNIGLLNFPIVILAYLIPTIILWVSGSDRYKDLLMGISWLLQGLTLGLVSWIILSSLSVEI